MGEVLLSVWSLVVFMLIGFALVRSGVSAKNTDRALSKIAFSALMPALMFTTIAKADLDEVFSTNAIVSITPIIIIFVAYYFIATHIFGLKNGEQTIGALSASYTNAGNIGAAYLIAVVGDASYAALVIMFQLCVITPTVFAMLSRQTGVEKQSMAHSLRTTFTQPILLGVFAGIVVALLQVDLPAFVDVPIERLAAVAVPIMMMSIGASFATASLPKLNRSIVPLATAVVMQLLVAPLLTFALARLVGLAGDTLLAVMALSTIPTANNVFNYAHRYDVGIILSRDTVLITVILSMPLLVAVVALFHG